MERKKIVLQWLQIAAGLGYAALRFGGSIQKIIEVAIKLAVTK